MTDTPKLPRGRPRTDNKQVNILLSPELRRPWFAATPDERREALEKGLPQV